MITTTITDGKTYAPVSELFNWDKNPRHITPEDFERLKQQIIELKEYKPLIVTEEGKVIGGNMRLKAYKELGIDKAWVSVIPAADEKYIVSVALSDNDRAGYYLEQKVYELVELYDINKKLFSMDILPPVTLEDLQSKDNKKTPEQARTTLMERFIIPPFSVFDTRQGYWQDRKRAWLGLGIKSELGREDDLTITALTTAMYDEKKEAEERLGRQLSVQEYKENYCTLSALSGTSVFDPVLCEISYKWFTPKNGKILDCFAGGSVRGIVASYLGYEYTGVELSGKQVDANRQQALDMNLTPQWIQGDSAHIKELAPGEYDFIFSCPPYADLEVYSDDPADLNNMPYPQFLEMYRLIINNTVSLLKDNRFACFVVGEVREKNGGHYKNFVSDTIDAFLAAGMKYYNEIMLLNTAGSLPIRAAKQFLNSRKVGKTHQNVLVFYKGDMTKIKDIYPTDLEIDTNFGEEDQN